MAARYLDERTYEIGDIIFAEGDPGSEMFIVSEGQVVITKQVAGRDVFLAAQGRGDFFGEMTLLTSSPRHGTCVALVPTRLVAIKSGELLMKLRRDPTFALEMLQQMTRRIGYLEEQMAKLMEQELASRQELATILAKSEYRLRDSSG
jgi:CRP/FNR family transcriptional regulator, cyclic AMP receptor protein